MGEKEDGRGSERGTISSEKSGNAKYRKWGISDEKARFILNSLRGVKGWSFILHIRRTVRSIRGGTS